MIEMLAAAVLAAGDPEKLIPGAWAAGETTEACKTAAITVFFTDGSLIIFDSPKGPLHAVATWRAADGGVYMSYNRAPFAGNAASRPASKLKIRELTATRFVTENPDGAVRTRVRCENAAVPEQ